MCWPISTLETTVTRVPVHVFLLFCPSHSGEPRLLSHTFSRSLGSVCTVLGMRWSQGAKDLWGRQRPSRSRHFPALRGIEGSPEPLVQSPVALMSLPSFESLTDEECPVLVPSDHGLWHAGHVCLVFLVSPSITFWVLMGLCSGVPLCSAHWNSGAGTDLGCLCARLTLPGSF